MPSILQRIVTHKRAEVAERQRALPLRELARSAHYDRPPLSLREALTRPGSSGVIAEFKRKSPSQRDIHLAARPELVVPGYQQAGAAACSVLTDAEFFGGGAADLLTARKVADLPLLRKDFIVDAYQIEEARALGADAILLIASYLSTEEIREYTTQAHALGLEVLAEVHDRAEVAKLCPDIDVVGVNNRNLKTFSIDLQQSLDLLPHLPAGAVKISESGIESVAAVQRLRATGYQGFLIGTYFMREADPAAACAAFIERISKEVSQ
ncbi:MAG: indole-3-glycerol phosphate synthase TrpC [Saprospiraceae bacterium]